MIMENNDSKKIKTRLAHPDRISLNEIGLKKVTSWLEQANGHLRGVKISRSDIVNWLISEQDEELSPQNLSALETQYFDQVKFGEWAIKDLKRRLSLGENVTLADIISGSCIKLKNDSNVSKMPSKKRKTGSQSATTFKSFESEILAPELRSGSPLEEKNPI